MYCHIWDNRNKRHVSLNIDELAGMLKNNRVVQDIMEQLLMPNEEKKSYFPFVVQKTGTYALVWDNKNKKHVSLNSDELMYILSNEVDIDCVTELLAEYARVSTLKMYVPF